MKTTTSRRQEQPQSNGSGGAGRYPQKCVQQQFHGEFGVGSSQTDPQPGNSVIQRFERKIRALVRYGFEDMVAYAL